MKGQVVLSIDQGTTGTRAILYDKQGIPRSNAYQEFQQYYPKPGWVEHDPIEIWHSTQSVIRKSLNKLKLKSSQIISIGITNQRETIVLWDRSTGKPVHRAVVWQDRRTADQCDSLKKKGLESNFRKKTGLVLDPYFSGTKIAWLLKEKPGLRKRVTKGDVICGTMDTWLIWMLTGGDCHVTDYTNASRTLLFNIKTKKWDSSLCKYLNVPLKILPEALPSGSDFGVTSKKSGLSEGIPIQAVMGDQQAALYGQGCYKRGEAKNTYGTGCFVVANMGSKYPKPMYGLLTTLACDADGRSVYALEGAIFIAGAAIQWLRDGVKFFKKAKESETLAFSVSDTGGVTLIPAFAGLGSPYWNPHVRGVISGLTRGTQRAHIVRAALESLSHQTCDVVESMNRQTPKKISALRVDGGATANKFLMQNQADLLGRPVLVCDLAECTAWGVAKLAAKRAGFWKDLSKIDSKRRYKRFYPKMRPVERVSQRRHWNSEITRLVSP